MDGIVFGEINPSLHCILHMPCSKFRSTYICNHTLFLCCFQALSAEVIKTIRDIVSLNPVYK